MDGTGKILEQSKHLLSLGDLDATTVLEDLIHAGVTSFKIEGRLKDSVYVKNITAHYHELLNRFIDQNPNYERASKGRCSIGFEPDPARSFNRGTSVYFYTGRNTGLVNTTTPKSLGKFVGKIAKTGRDWFSLDTNETLANGDGLCFQHNGQLMGTQIDGKTAEGYKPQSMDGLELGIDVYRNRDHEFIKQVEKSNAPRKLPVNIDVHFTSPEIVVTANASPEEVNLTLDFGTETAQNQERASENWKTQMAKTGDTCFAVTTVELHGTTLPHMPMSRINEIRRNILEMLQQQIVHSHINNRTISKIQQTPYHLSVLTYQHNVSNNLAQEFYSKRGVTQLKPAFELEKPAEEEYTVMTTRYCLLFELGKCKKLITKQQQLAEPLFLVHRERKFRLEFDCHECQMLVKSNQNKQ
jgi:putative protease